MSATEAAFGEQFSWRRMMPRATAKFNIAIRELLINRKEESASKARATSSNQIRRQPSIFEPDRIVANNRSSMSHLLSGYRPETSTQKFTRLLRTPLDISGGCCDGGCVVFTASRGCYMVNCPQGKQKLRALVLLDFA